ncbi:hypothetical protein C8J57DRAFT_1730085 [Mycena rebaudengoi]|nr:hypothetical protein C8J57DRAFT_1730085 [Mycena rebaudengoi]
MPVNFDILVILAGLLAPAVLVSTMDLDFNRTLFTPEASDLPAGTYIATGIAGVTQLADYLDTYSDTRITRLLVSDSTVQDVDAEHGHLFTDATSKEESEWDEGTHHRVWAAVHDFEEPLNRILAKAAPTLEALSFLAYISYSARLHQVVYPEWTDPRLEPLVQHNYPSLTQLNFPRPGRHLDGTLIPGNLTVIAEPALSALRDEGRDFECEYDDSILTSLSDDGVHVKLPIEDDRDTERGGVSLRREIAEFVEGEWALPGRLPGREEWCRWRRQCSDAPGYHRDESEL